jgi:hypothetical protein
MTCAVICEELPSEDLPRTPTGHVTTVAVRCSRCRFETEDLKLIGSDFYCSPCRFSLQRAA